jgi:hypothetical protein
MIYIAAIFLALIALQSLCRFNREQNSVSRNAKPWRYHR